MTACEKCWGDAHQLATFGPYVSQPDAYHALLTERADDPCSPEERAGQSWDAESQRDSREERSAE